MVYLLDENLVCTSSMIKASPKLFHVPQIPVFKRPQAILKILSPLTLDLRASYKLQTSIARRSWLLFSFSIAGLKKEKKLIPLHQIRLTSLSQAFKFFWLVVAGVTIKLVNSYHIINQGPLFLLWFRNKNATCTNTQMNIDTSMTICHFVHIEGRMPTKNMFHWFTYWQ